MSNIIFSVQESTRTVREVTKYLRAAGHQCEVLTNGTEAEKRLEAGVPDLVVSTEFVPPRFVFDLVGALKKHHPEAATHWLLLTTVGPHSEPSRYWPDMFDAYVMADADKWQLILAIEQFFYRSVTRKSPNNAT